MGNLSMNQRLIRVPFPGMGKMSSTFATKTTPHRFMGDKTPTNTILNIQHAIDDPRTTIYLMWGYQNNTRFDPSPAGGHFSHVNIVSFCVSRSASRSEDASTVDAGGVIRGWLSTGTSGNNSSPDEGSGILTDGRTWVYLLFRHYRYHIRGAARWGRRFIFLTTRRYRLRCCTWRAERKILLRGISLEIIVRTTAPRLSYV